MEFLLANALAFSFQAFESGIAAGITIAARTPLLFGGATSSPRAVAETHRMLSEKVEAAMEGAVAAQVAMVTLCAGMATGQVKGPMGVVAGLAKVAEAATRPAHRRVRANAKRLIGGGMGY